MNNKIIFNDYNKVKVFSTSTDAHVYLYYYVDSAIWVMITTDEGVITFNGDLTELSPEEYFQQSLIWDYSFPLDCAIKIMTVAKSEEYNFSKVKSVLVQEGLL